MHRRFAQIIGGLLAIMPMPAAFATDAPSPACASFARPFYLIARNRDRGVTKDTAISNYKHGKSRNDQDDPTMPPNWMQQVITTVYNYPNTSGDELERRAVAACSVDAEGKVQFAGL